MRLERNGTAVFELKGRSLWAAKRLEEEIRKELETTTPQSTGLLSEIHDSWNKFYEGLIRRLSGEAPWMLRLTGLTSPAVQVSHEKDSLPRAYREFPDIFSSPGEPPRYFMYVPVDYNGNHFTPPDGVQLTREQAEKVDDLLFAGGWLGNAPLVNRPKAGVETPADYDPLQNSFLRRAQKDRHTQRTFIAGGESLAAVEDYEKRTAAWRAAAEKAREAIQVIAEAEFPQLLEALPEGEGLRASVGYSYGGNLNGKTQMMLSVRQEGNVDFMAGGKPVALQDNDAYTLTKRYGGEYTVEPRRDTEAGKQLAAIMDAIPKTPSLGDYPQLRGDFTFYPNPIEAAFSMNGTTPHVRKFGSSTVLVYNTDVTETGNFTPPGATPLPLKAYKWLEADERDRNQGITPPPMPQELRTLWGTPPKPRAGAPKP